MGESKKERPRLLAGKLAAVRSALGLSQNELLGRLGVADKYTREEISAYERGVREPPLHILLGYSKAARVWVNVLIDDGLDLPPRLPAERMHEGVPRQAAKRGR